MLSFRKVVVRLSSAHACTPSEWHHHGLYTCRVRAARLAPTRPCHINMHWHGPPGRGARAPAPSPAQPLSLQKHAQHKTAGACHDHHRRPRAPTEPATVVTEPIAPRGTCQLLPAVTEAPSQSSSSQVAAAAPWQQHQHQQQRACRAGSCRAGL
jgi:hypothetical protein